MILKGLDKHQPLASHLQLVLLTMPRRERSRSPHGEVALALPASSSDTLPRSFDLNKMELTLDGNVVNMYHFADEPDMPWFQAKPIMTFLGYSNITVTLNRLEQDERNTLKDLIEKKGPPIEVIGDPLAIGYNDAKALYVNESGLYALIMGSKKSEAKEFKHWVTGEVLPSIRRQGFYGNGQGSNAATSPVLAQRAPSSHRLSQSPLSSPFPVALPEVCLDWRKDFAVSRQELRGVKSQFKAILSIEISAGHLPQRCPVEAWMMAPPLRFREFAQGAVSSYRSLLERRYGTVTVGDAERASVASRRPSQESDSDDDILKISEIMSKAGVWQAVWSSYRSDLANQMLSLKCTETGASFSARRPEIVQGHIHILVHKYKKSTDWPLAWMALRNSRDVYEKRIREFLDDMFRMAGRPVDERGESTQLARDIAATLKVSA